MAEERHCSECGRSLPADAPQGLCPQCLIKLGLPTGAEVQDAASPDKPNDIPTSGTPSAGFVPPEPGVLAEQFPQFEILDLLGQGGMGAVYKARQRQLDRVVALKILPPQIGRTEAFAERFTREARSLARLSHPGIVMVYDFGHTEAGLYYFVMEFVDGTDLRHVIRSAQLSPAEALSVVPQICEALQYAHEEGVVHRDIKPENIMLNKKGQIKITDFGLAKLLDQPATAHTLTQAGQRMGTPHYMAPEQIEHPHLVDHRADIYSLGVVFYEMLTGELPLGRFPLPSNKVHIDVRLDEVVLKTLEKEPERRYQHASEVKIDVETISSESHVSGPAAEAAEEPEEDDGTKAVRHRVWIPAVGLLVAGGINCLAVVGLVIAAVVGLLAKGFSGRLVIFGFLPGAGNAVVLAVTVAYAVFVVLGGWNLMQLRSRRLALWGSILALFPFSAGSVVGLPMGIWALIVMRNEQVKAAFGQKRIEVAVPPKVRDFAVSAAGDVKEAFVRGKAEVEKIIARNEAGAEQSSGLPRQSDASALGKTHKLAIGSFVLGFVSILMTSLAPGRIDWLVLVFPPAFIAIFLGVLVMRRIRPYRHHIGDTVLVIVGVVTGSISVLSLFGRVM
ncbi:MAG TPA: serine/threonine-protein kinase [Sedimentisphaerales bacterium]|nr:serine/threonine-protein kinase [Sedimentisphaerales bacterium]